jgi:two-component system sensor histidine kinase DegS
VSAERNENLESLIGSALSAIRNLETQIATLGEDVGRLTAEFSQERTKVQQEREEKDIFYSLETGASYLVAAPDTVELRALEKDLVESALRASTLERRLFDFVSVLSVSRRQFESEGELPDIDSATDIALRTTRVQAQEDERRRFAREIHDGPAQAFANAIIGLEFVERAIKMGDKDKPVPALDEIERIKGSLREGLTEIRRFIFDLRPTMLQDRGLIATIEHYIATYKSILPLNVELYAVDHIPWLTHDQELTAFRVIQESLHNSTKYARASQVAVNIAVRDDSTITVSIRDDGRGFDPDQVTAHTMGGSGIKGMCERAELVGGVVTVKSSPGQGTCVDLVLPLVHS